MSVCWLVGHSVCLLVCNNCEPCKNGWTNWDAIWCMDSVGPRNYVLYVQIPHEQGHLWGWWHQDFPVFCRAPTLWRWHRDFLTYCWPAFRLADCRSSRVSRWIFFNQNTPLQCGLSSNFFDYLLLLKAWQHITLWHLLQKHSCSVHNNTTQQLFYGPLSGTTQWAGTRRNTPSWSSSNLYQLLPSTTIHSILPVQIMSTSWSGALHLIFHTFLHPISVFFSQHTPLSE